MIDYDWRQVGRFEDLRQAIDPRIKEEGWYEYNGDWLLILKSDTGPNYYVAYCFSGQDPREELKRVSELPVHDITGSSAEGVVGGV